MRSSQHLQTIERRLIDGILSDTSWAQALDDIATLAGAPYASIMSRHPGTGEFECLETLSTPAEMLHDYEASFSLLNPINALPVLKRPGEQYVDTQVLGQRVVSRHPFYQDFLRRYDVGYLMGLHIGSFDGVECNLSIHRATNETPFDKVQAEHIARLHEPLSQAFRVRRRLHLLEHAQQWSRVALNHLSFPVLMVNAQGSVLQANDAAEVWLTQPGCPLGHGMGSQRRERLTLLAAIRQVASGEASRPQVLPLDPCAPGAVERLVVIPIPEHERQHDLARPAVLLMAWESTRRTPASDLLKALFGLTPAEADVALRLGAGHPPTEIAAQRGCAISTVRAQMQSLFAKTHTRRQQDLTALLTELAVLRWQP